MKAAMKAAVFEGPGRPLAIREVAAPELGPHEAIVKVEACGICGSDLHSTEEGPFLQKPGTILGHEFAGVVAASSDPAAPEGRRVTALPVDVGACGRCRDLGRCAEGLGILCPNRRINGLTRDLPGAYAEYVKVDSRQIMPLPDGVGFDQGALVEPLAVGLHAVQKAEMAPGARALVIGAGFIGLSAAAFARLGGASAVIVSERSAGRRAAALKSGVDAAIDPTEVEDLGAAFAERAGGPPDVIFECVGAPGLIQQCIELSAPRGAVVVVGVCLKPDEILPAAAMHKELRLQFAMGYAAEDFARVLEALEQGLIETEGLITDHVALSELPEAFEALRRPDRQIKVMIHPGR